MVIYGISSGEGSFFRRSLYYDEPHNTPNQVQSRVRRIHSKGLRTEYNFYSGFERNFSTVR